MLLYPTLFREYLATDSLSFQFAPGLSTTGRTLAPLISDKDSQIAYLTDGDGGGIAIAQNLERNGVNKRRIVILRNSEGTAVEIEDFIDPRLLLLAANRILGRFHSEAEPIPSAELTIARRMNSLEAAYRVRAGVSLPKVELAYELLDVIDERPSQSLLDSRRRGAFGKIAKKVTELFQPEKK